MKIRKKLLNMILLFGLFTLVVMSICLSVSYRITLKGTQQFIEERTNETMDILSHGLYQTDSFKNESMAELMKYMLISQVRESYSPDQIRQEYEENIIDWQAMLDSAGMKAMELGIELDYSYENCGLYAKGLTYAYGSASPEERFTNLKQVVDICMEQMPDMKEQYPTLDALMMSGTTSMYAPGSERAFFTNEAICIEEIEDSFAWQNIEPQDRHYIASFFNTMFQTDGSHLHDICVELTTAENVETLAAIEHHFRQTIMNVMVVLLICILAIVFIFFRATSSLATEVEEEHKTQVHRIEEVEKDKQAFEEMNLRKTRFLSDFSHELKTPLTVISGYAQTMEQQLEEDGTLKNSHGTLKKIHEQANQMALMVNQILDITRIEEGRKVLRQVPLYIDEIINATVETYLPILNQNDNNLEVNVPFDLPMVYADAAKVQRILINLLSNALKATKKGLIVISAQELDNMVEISVKDNGRGMSKTMQANLFNRYEKGSDMNSTGLGMYICKNLVEEQYGTISVTSAEGVGTTVRFTLPIDSGSTARNEE